MTKRAPIDPTLSRSPAAERNVWNNIASPETITSERQRGRQIVIITAVMILIGMGVAAALILGWDLPWPVRW